LLQKPDILTCYRHTKMQSVTKSGQGMPGFSLAFCYEKRRAFRPLPSTAAARFSSSLVEGTEGANPPARPHPDRREQSENSFYGCAANSFVDPCSREYAELRIRPKFFGDGWGSQRESTADKVQRHAQARGLVILMAGERSYSKPSDGLAHLAVVHPELCWYAGQLKGKGADRQWSALSGTSEPTP